MECASALDTTLRELPARVYPAALKLALRSLALPREERSPLLGVLKQLGVSPYAVAGFKYRKFAVWPREDHIALAEVSHFSQVTTNSAACLRFKSWVSLVEHATRHKAALRSWGVNLAGDYDTRFEHLVGLPLSPMVWCGGPLRLDITDVRANVVVCALHCGDFKPVVPDVLRAVLFAQHSFGVLTVAASGHLIATRRTNAWNTTHTRALRDCLERLVGHRLITRATSERFMGAMPWGQTREQKPEDDLHFALECLGTHAGSPFPHAESCQTMSRLAPALLAVGGYFDSGAAVADFARDWKWQRLHPWSVLLADTPLHEIVRNFA